MPELIPKCCLTQGGCMIIPDSWIAKSTSSVFWLGGDSTAQPPQLLGIGMDKLSFQLLAHSFGVRLLGPEED